MTIPSGLGATLGIVQEVTVGTPLPVTRWLIFDSESLTYKKKTTESKGIRGALYSLGSRRVDVSHTVDGKLTMDLVDKGLGIVLANMIGSTAVATQVGATAAWLQTHVPGPLVGRSFTVQKGVPDTGGVMHPFTYNGCKIVDWQISVKEGEIVKLEVSLDAWNEDPTPAYVAASYVAADPFHFAEGQLLLGGVVSTTGGVTSVAGGASPLGVVKSATVKAKNPLDVTRFSLGSTSKREQLDDNWRDITGDIELEFASLADAYTAMQADTPMALQLGFTGPVIGAPNHSFCNILCPQVYIDDAPPVVGGPGVVTLKTTFTALDNGVDPPIQIQYQSTDLAV